MIDLLNPSSWSGDNSTMVAAIAQVGATMVSFGGMVFVGLQLRQGQRSGDLTSLLTFRRDTDTAEEAFVLADSERKDDAFHDLMNHLECYAGAYNGKLFAKTTKKFVKGKLCDSIVVIQNQPSWASKMDGLLTSPRTFAELRRFCEKNRRMIQKTSDIYRARAAEVTSKVIEVDISPSQIPDNPVMSATNTHS
jgi:hypothetical protein